jgi:predicted nucleotidyltransferase
MPLKLSEILETLQQHREKIKGYGVRRLGLFGSQARREANAISDLDFVVEFEKKSFDTYMDLKFFLEDLFSLPVDLVISDTIKPRLREVIKRETVDVPGL